MEDIARKLAGRFIVIDGPDGAGKSTQMEMLADRLEKTGASLVRTRDPGGTVIGDKIRDILLDGRHDTMSVECEVMLYMASRAQLVAEVIRPALAEGRCVLCDRYISATVAYQGAGGADIDAIRRVGEIAVGGLMPDLTIILDIPADEGLSRLGESPDRMESKDAAFHRRVREMFLEQAEQMPERFEVAEATGPPESVHKKILDAISAYPWE